MRSEISIPAVRLDVVDSKMVSAVGIEPTTY